MNVTDIKIGIIGLGYVGLPLAVEFGKIFNVIGFDVSATRIQELCEGIDDTLEIQKTEITSAKLLSFTSDASSLSGCDVFIVTVPTPLNNSKQPDLKPLKDATKTVGRMLRPGNIVIYESTVYPGATEEVCVPILERLSGLKYNVDFFAGYSPERINPGDKQRSLPNIVKVTSGSNSETAQFVDSLYATIISAGTYLAESIKVAEASKVIENTQRDINIALMNELAMLFEKLNIDTGEVLSAARTKWNFLDFAPGLVGGHCIGVDPYYLTHKAQQVGYHPEIILSGRRVNDSVADHVANTLIKTLIKRNKNLSNCKILILGVTFKENCPDIRNSKVFDIYNHIIDLGMSVDILDPWVKEGPVKSEYGIEIIQHPKTSYYDAIILAVPHREFIDMGIDMLKKFGNEGCIFYDIKSYFPKNSSDIRL